MKPTQSSYRSNVQVLDSFWHVLLGAAFAFILGAWASESRAADEQAPSSVAESQLWVDSGFWSHHTHDRPGPKPYRQNNIGLGLEWRYAPQWQVNVGHYRNSVDGASNYFQWGWTPLSWAPLADFQLEAGGSVGVVNGYKGIHDGKYFPTLVPVVAAQWKRVGVNLVYIPSVGQIQGAYAAQLKLRVF